MMVRTSGDILQGFPRNLSLPPFVESSTFICVCVDFHWPNDVCKHFFIQHNGTTCIPRWFQTFFIFTLPGEMIQFHSYIFKWVGLKPPTGFIFGTAQIAVDGSWGLFGFPMKI